MTESPHELSERLLVEANEYATLSERLVTILERKPAVWMELRKTLASDSSTDRAWDGTRDGLDEMALRMRLKAIDKTSSALKAMLRTMEGEARNQW